MSYVINIIETPEQLREIIPEWLAFLEAKPLGILVYNDPRFILERYEHEPFYPDPNPKKLHIIVLRRDGRICGILPTVISKKRVYLNFSYKRIPGPKLWQMICYGDALIHEDAPDRNEALFSALIDFLSADTGFDLFYSHDVRTDTPFARYCLGNRDKLMTRFPDVRLSLQHDHLIELPETFDQFMASRNAKQRHSMKRRASSFDKQFPEARLVCYRDQEEAPYFLEKSDIVSQVSWKSLTFGFMPQNTPENREKFLAFAKYGWLRSYILFSKDAEPLAFIQGYEYRGVYYMENMCFVQSYEYFAPGRKCLYYTVQELLSKNSSHLIDFGFGDFRYKREWSNVVVPSASVSVACSIKGRIFLRSQKAIDVMTTCAKKIVDRLGIADRIQKMLKHKNEQPNSSDSKLTNQSEEQEG